MVTKCKLVAAVIALAGVTSVASAVDFTSGLANPSFDNQGTVSYNAGSVPYGAAVPGWAFQVDDPFTGTSGSNAAGANTRDTINYPNQTGGTGAFLGFFNNNAVNQQSQAFANVDTPDGYQPNRIYTLTVALGNLAGTGASYTDPGNYRLQFKTQQSDTVIASSALISGASIPDGSLKDFTFVFTTPANFNPIPGDDAVRVQIQTFATAANQQQSFDNVRLDISLVPEPVSTGLLGLGALALGRRRRA